MTLVFGKLVPVKADSNVPRRVRGLKAYLKDHGLADPTDRGQNTLFVKDYNTGVVSTLAYENGLVFERENVQVAAAGA